MIDAVLALQLLEDDCSIGGGNYHTERCQFGYLDRAPLIFQLLAPFALLDLPASIVADTLLLPYSLSVSDAERDPTKPAL